MADNSVQQQIVEKIKDSNTILVTVNSNPTVDELSAALGITLFINKLNKHATAVFSGDIPPAIEFLNPGKTFENTVDSLRDFIIALDKEKADHLRYKVDGEVVKIFITPYRTTISEADLDFSQGDYNVELVISIGVKTEEDLDKALTAHGRILHDASVVALSLDETTQLGDVRWSDTKASSYSEMLVGLTELLKSDTAVVDEQIATAFLTGIVAATDRFSNNKTSSTVMTTAAQLMSAGANQQLIANKLQQDNAISPPTPEATPEDGLLKEGESTKVDKTDKTPKKAAADKTKKSGDGAGDLTISHVPEGNVDEVAAQVAEENSSKATARAEEELAKQTNAVAVSNQGDAAQAAEDKLAEQLAGQLAASTPATVPPTTEQIQKDIANVNESVEPKQPLRGPVSSDKWRSRTEDKVEQPSLGGTLNATSQQAEVDKRHELADERNKTILSHNGGSYASDAPTFQAPLNSTVPFGSANAEPDVIDIFAQGDNTDVTAHADAIQPPVLGTAQSPTLAEIDAKNRIGHSEALGAVNAAFDSPASEPAKLDVPGLPPLPPMPDFSTLPPLPGGSNTTATSVPDALGTILPPSTAPTNQAVQPADPAQFRLPGK